MLPDALRGVAVLGILIANLPGFGLPAAAAFTPAAAGGRTGADLAAWVLTFVAVEGKMRALFSALFGASLLLAADRAMENRAAAEGRDPAAEHFARMAALLGIGLAHLYLLWWGDILAHYALVGCAAFAFRQAGTRALMVAAALLLGVQQADALAYARTAAWAAAGTSPAQVAAWDAVQAGFGTPPPAALAAEVGALGGSWADGVAWRWRTAPGPLGFLVAGGAETLAYMLLGMAALRSGMLTGGWSRARLRRWAIVALAAAWPAYAALAWWIAERGFDAGTVVLGSYALTVGLRPVAAAGYLAALALLLGPGGWWTTRLAAAGRTALSNYLGTSLVMAWVFGGWGLGLFGRLTRAELYLLAPPAWALMLWWPGPWLRRFRLGPAEWAWRSLAALRPLPMRR